MSAEWFRSELDKKINTRNMTTSLRVLSENRVIINHVAYKFIQQVANQWDEKAMLENSTCQNFLDRKDQFVGTLYDNNGERYTYLVYNCSENAHCCGYGCCAKYPFLILFIFVVLSAFLLFGTLRFGAKFCCKKVQKYWHNGGKRILEADNDLRLKYIGNVYVRTSQVDKCKKLYATSMNQTTEFNTKQTD